MRYIALLKIQKDDQDPEDQERDIADDPLKIRAVVFDPAVLRHTAQNNADDT